MAETKCFFIPELTARGSLPPELGEELSDELAAEGFFNRDVFSFVGIYYSVRRDAIVIGAPKYWPFTDGSPQDRPLLMEEIGLLCQVAAQADLPSGPRCDDQFRPSELHGAMHTSNPYELAVFLLQDYAENGLYQERVTKVRRDGVGSYSWSRTLRHTAPVFDRRRPLYLQPISVQRRRAASAWITPLHAYAVRSCAKLLQPLRLFKDLELPEGAALPPPGLDLSQYIPVLNEKLVQTFSERDLRLLRALRAWCGQTPFNRTRFGVTSFELLWQYAANRYFGNVSDTRSGVPKYYIDADPDKPRVFSGVGDAIPDILYAAREPAGRKGLAIFDAKYYCPRWRAGEGRVTGAPPNSDIAKQIQYYHSLRSRYPDDKLRFSNAFLLPDTAAEGLYRYMGSATEADAQNQEIANKLGCTLPAAVSSDRVLLYGVNPTELWKACLKNKKVSSQEIFQEFIPRFEKERERM